jgi:hypothetical protein
MELLRLLPKTTTTHNPGIMLYWKHERGKIKQGSRSGNIAAEMGCHAKSS